MLNIIAHIGIGRTKHWMHEGMLIPVFLSDGGMRALSFVKLLKAPLKRNVIALAPSGAC